MPSGKEFSVTFFGVRGGYPACGTRFSRFGGDTPCLLVRAGRAALIFDAGTGLAALGKLRTAALGTDIRLFLSHLHYDHILGLPFFAPLYDENVRLRLFGPAGFKSALNRAIRPPFFPLSLSKTPSNKSFSALRDGLCLSVAPGVRVRVYKGNHPRDGVFVFRVEFGGKSLVYATDIELPTQNSRRYAAFIGGCDLLIHDTQYTDKNYRAGKFSKAGWGHSAVEQVCLAAREAGVGKLVLFHHDPDETDSAVAKKLSLARARAGLPVLAAAQGLRLSV